MLINEPVAWMLNGIVHEFDPSDWSKEKYPDQAVIPLYTHPVKELDEQFKKGFEAGKEEGWKAHKFHHPVKELTDEEILEVANGFPFIENGIERCKFARAILRKAQEK